MTPLLKANIDLQLNAGAEAVMILDTAAGEVSVDFFERYIAPQLKFLAKDQVGYYMKGGALEVGKASTLSFVWTSIIIIIVNFIITQLLLS